MNDMEWAELLALVEAQGNVSRACERLGISRSLYYKWRKLKKPGDDSPPGSQPGRRIHPHAISEPVKLDILAIARSNPEWGCQRISYFLELKGTRVSGSTVHKLVGKDRLRKGARKNQ